METNRMFEKFVILDLNNHFYSMETITTIRPPRTIREVFDSLPEGTIAQIIENQLVVTSPYSDPHQKTLNELNLPIYNYLNEYHLGKIRIGLYGV